jgi:hypothetical protein
MTMMMATLFFPYAANVIVDPRGVVKRIAVSLHLKMHV